MKKKEMRLISINSNDTFEEYEKFKDLLSKIKFENLME